MILITNRFSATFGRNKKFRTASFCGLLADVRLRKAIVQAPAHRFSYALRILIRVNSCEFVSIRG